MQIRCNILHFLTKQKFNIFSQQNTHKFEKKQLVIFIFKTDLQINTKNKTPSLFNLG